jgi:hypothetical protein
MAGQDEHSIKEIMTSQGFNRATVVPFKGPSHRLNGKIVAPMSAEIQNFNNLQ